MRTLLSKSMLVLYAIISLAFFVSCSSEDGIGVVPVTGVKINHPTLSSVEGDVDTLVVTVLPMDATNRSVVWSSSDNSVAKVNKGGVVSSISAGEAIISVTTDDGEMIGRSVVTVSKDVIPLTGIKIDQTTLSLEEGGDAATLLAIFTPKNTTERDVTWSSSDETLAVVDEVGVVTPLNDGEVVITVTAKDKSKSGNCIVTITPKYVPVIGVKIDPSLLVLIEGGEPKSIVAVFTPENASNKNLTWSISDKTVATIDELGVVTPLKAGEAVITVVTGDRVKRATCDVTVIVPTVVELGGNSYVTVERSGAKIDHNRGLISWVDAKSVISTYFYMHEAGTFDLDIEAQGHSEITVKCGDKAYNVKVDSDEFTRFGVGTFTVEKPGYVCVDLQGVSAASGNFGQVKALLVGAKGKMTYVHDFENYWGRRGPSVHMKYNLPAEDVEWFYNEVTVPKEGETMSSYYMAAGFGEGYFGMQYNSGTERRVLFSLWSPYVTDKPGDIPEEYRIVLKKKGRDVYIGEFGNEGSGGQSYLRYNWTAGETYKFLMQVHPDGNGNTIYTAYFFATDDNEWRLIASFMRPKTDTWYTNSHSFLENFSPEQGYLTREVKFSNQWAHSVSGQWIRLKNATFTHDATASAGVRLDFAGGVLDNGSFYLKMGGFFNETTKGYTNFISTYEGVKPDVDFDFLETIK